MASFVLTWQTTPAPSARTCRTREAVVTPCGGTVPMGDRASGGPRLLLPQQSPGLRGAGVQTSSGRIWSGRSMFPRQAPVSWSRDSMNSLKLPMSFLTLWVRTPSLSAMFSTKPSGSMSICAVTLVCESSNRWKVITPA